MTKVTRRRAAALLLFSPLLTAGERRILLVGDSWMAGTWLSKAGDRALAAHGLERYVTEGADTAIGGSRADQWASNHQGKLDKLREALERYPTIDIVHLCIGGNDFLRFASTTDLAKLTPAERRAQWAAIRKDIQKVVDAILAERPNLRVVIADYDYLDPALIAKVYKAGFENAFFGVSRKAFNEALVELGQEKLEIAKRTPRCFYVGNWGLLRAAMPDGVHPTPEGFQLVFENAVKQFYSKWLRE